jgi:tetratricopeptide (TPR) repeat protein
MGLSTLNKRYRQVCGFVFSMGLATVVVAQPLDDVSLEYQSDGIVATIHTTAPVQYLRHFPAKSGKTLEIFFERAQDAAGSESWVDTETRNSPPSGLIPSFTVTSRDALTKPRLVIEFEREAEFTVTPGKDNRSLRITIRPDKAASKAMVLPFLPTIKAAVAATPAAVSSEEAVNLAQNNQQARALMGQAREALAVRNNEAAIDAFNQLLLLPPNDYTQDGQEWVGVARERAGQIDKAKTEYDLYLRLYAEGEGVLRVMQRLSALSGQGKAQVAVATEEKKKEGRWMSFGSISTHYYYGNSTSDSTQIYNNVSSTTTDSMTDTSMLITSEDASMRYMSDEYDARVVFRNVNTANFLEGQSGTNRLNAAYGEIKNRKLDYMLRAGRQSSSGGGVMGRFDGVYGSYGRQEARANAVVGRIADNSSGSKPTFFGASYDMGAYSIYGINQSVDGTQDRRALGAEWRYFEDKKTLFAGVDYDTYFKELNSAQLMGTLNVTNVNVNFMLDHRKAPFLSIRNALIGAGTSSINDLLLAKGDAAVRDLALARTATSNMAQLGATWPFTQKWQVGGDLRLFNTTGLPASGTTALEGILDAQASRGVEKSVSAQVVGSGIYKAGDIWSASASVTTSSAVNGEALGLNNHLPFANGWVMDSLLQFRRQTDQSGGVTRYFSPLVRGAYNLRDNLALEMDCAIERAFYDGAMSSTATTRYSTSVGMRLDF